MWATVAKGQWWQWWQQGWQRGRWRQGRRRKGRLCTHRTQQVYLRRPPPKPSAVSSGSASVGQPGAGESGSGQASAATWVAADLVELTLRAGLLLLHLHLYHRRDVLGLLGSGLRYNLHSTRVRVLRARCTKGSRHAHGNGMGTKRARWIPRSARKARCCPCTSWTCDEARTCWSWPRRRELCLETAWPPRNQLNEVVQKRPIRAGGPKAATAARGSGSIVDR